MTNNPYNSRTVKELQIYVAPMLEIFLEHTHIPVEEVIIVIEDFYDEDKKTHTQRIWFERKVK